MFRKNKDGRPRKTVIKIGGLGCSLPIVILLVVVLVISGSMMISSVREALGIGEWPTSFSDLLPDEIMGYNDVEITQAILGEVRDRDQLIVMEQDIEVQTEIRRALANISLFEKTKTIYSYGTGAYGIDLSALTEGAITYDHDRKEVIVRIPHAALAYVDPDFSKTKFGDTEKALFAFGELKMTQEQENVVNKEVEDAMWSKLNTGNRLAVADLKAVQRVKGLLIPIVNGIDEDYKLKVVQD